MNGIQLSHRFQKRVFGQVTVTNGFNTLYGSVLNKIKSKRQAFLRQKNQPIEFKESSAYD